MSKYKLNAEQLNTMLTAITYRLQNFPRADIINKLRSADAAFHLAKFVNTDGKISSSDGADNRDREADQDHSRYQELQNALVREVCETYGAEYISTFLSKSQVFAMTSSEEKQADAQKFNVIFSDQSKRTKWAANLSKVLMDVSKYNLCAVDTYWGSQVYYSLGRESGENVSSNVKLKKTKNTWNGNFIKRLDPYNTCFDVSVPPEEVSAKGEWGGYIELYTQVELKKLIDSLLANSDADVYLDDYKDPNNKNFNIYETSRGTTTGTSARNMGYETPDITTYGAGRDNSESGNNRTNWLTHLGTRDNTNKTQRHYEVFKGYLRLVPSAYGFPTKLANMEDDDIQIWEVYILEQNRILATVVRQDAHDLLPIDIGCTDSDSLQHDGSGPAQVTIPYSKLAKQLTDRVLAGADRAIGDRGFYDPNLLDETVVNSNVPDAKMPLKKGMPPGKKISDYYMSLPFDNSATARLYQDKDAAEQSGRQAVGLNQAQQGQFVKGNKTLYEFDQTMQNADSKPFQRSLFLENTMFTSIKTKIKINILQYQETAKLTDPDSKQEIDVNPAELFEASVDYKVIDSLMPSEYMLSPNVQQQLFQLLGTNAEMFQNEGYNVSGIISHVLSQSNGINMEQYKATTENGET